MIAAAAMLLFAVAGTPEQGVPFSCTAVSVHDGDGPIHCRELGPDGRAIRIRLPGIAARETDGSCRPGHPCPAASAEEARRALASLAVGRQLSCRQVGTSYGRVVAWCATPAGVDLSCAQISAGMALRWERYDREGRLSGC
ncbi:MAG TPA: hypothetical protein VN231_06145 [Allosphingosinicella sp.]|nr:hypothetical protein [Allosphingosinicella sp.]